MESSLRHILHFSNPEVDNGKSGNRSPTLSRVQPQVEHNGRNLTIDELSHAHDAEDTAPPGDVNGVSRKRSNPNSRLAYPRKRAIRACQKCRLRRTKCDNIRPSCTACLDLGAECIYSEGDPSTFDTASLAILDKLNIIEDLLRKPVQAPTSQPLSPFRHDSSSSHVVQTPASVPSVVSAAAPEKTITSTRRRMSIEAVLSWSAFTEQTPNLDLKSLLVADDIARSAASSLTTDFFHEHGGEEQLLQRFLDHVFIYNPVLEEADLQQYVRDIQFHGLQWDAKSCLLLLIYAHGCLTFSEEIQNPLESMTFRQTAEFRRAESFFDAAQKRMGVLLSRSTLVEAQCFFLAGVYLMATLRPLEAWKMFVQALTCCQAFTPEHKPSVEAREREQRLQESIYWTCFKSELELRLELNVFENSIWDLTYPAFYPSPPDTLKSQREVVWYYYLAQIALRRLGNRILNKFHKSSNNDGNQSTGPTSNNTDIQQSNIELDIDAVASFEQQASDWIRSLPIVLNFEITTPSSHQQQSPGQDSQLTQLTNSLKFILDGHLLDCYEMMYWPFLAELIFHPNFSPNTAAAVETLAYKSLRIAAQRIQKNEHGFYGRHHGTWLMLRSCTRSALVLIAARKDPLLVRLLPSDWEAAVWKVVRMLRFWRHESRDSDDRLVIIERAMRGFKEEEERNEEYRRRSSAMSN